MRERRERNSPEVEVTHEFGCLLKLALRLADEAGVDDLTKEFLAESLEGLDRMERCLTELETRPDDRELSAEIFRAVHTIKGATGFLGFGRLEALAHVGENLLCSLRAGRVMVTTDLISGLLALLDGLRAVLRLIETTGCEGQRSTDEDFELIGRLLELNASAGERGESLDEGAVAQARGAASPRTAICATDDDSTRLVGLADAAERRVLMQGPDKALRIEVEVLNRMMNLVGELVSTRNQILQSGGAAEGFPDLARRLDTVTAELQCTVMQARMQPLGHLFGKFPRLVRDLAQVCGRRVRIEFEGQATELDKSLLEAVRDPLTHAVRNAVDHGIEPPEERLRAGKEPEGVIRLRAFHQNGSVVIEVADDGRGIPVKQVLEKAIERGLVTPAQSASMSEREAMQLVFAPGFSTADKVTSVSGRGVGMDVVRANVENAGGTVEIDSRSGVGTWLRLRLPLTIAIVPALVVRSAGQSYALPQRTLVELVHVPPVEVAQRIERVGSAEVFRYRGELLPLVRLDRVLGEQAGTEGQGQGFYIAVMGSDDSRYGLLVDELLSPEEIVVKPFPPALRQSGVFVGAAVLGNGGLAMILDVPGIAARACVRSVGADALAPVRSGARERAEAEEPERQPVVVYEVQRVGAGSNEVERIALPLSVVERIEMVARERIEYAGGRAMLQYCGELLPVEDEGGVLRRQNVAEMTMLIRQAPRRMGIVVERVVDVCSATLPSEGAGARAEVVNERATWLRDDLSCELLEEVA